MIRQILQYNRDTDYTLWWLCYSKTWGNSAILWSLTVTAQMTHHDDILPLFGLCWIANVWNKKPVFVYSPSQCYHQCMLLGVCLPSALTKDEWAPFWIQRHFNFHAYAVLGLCWDCASKSATYKNGFMTHVCPQKVQLVSDDRAYLCVRVRECMYF